MLQQGDTSGLDSYKRFEANFLATGSKIGLTGYRMYAAQLAFELGSLDESDAMIIKSKILMDETGELLWLSDLYRLQARISIHKADPQSAEIQLLKALEIARKQQTVLWELRASIDLARLWQEQEKTVEAIADCPARTDT